MRDDLVDRCTGRPEYTTIERAGTLEAYCACIIDTLMPDLSPEERVAAAFYLFGDGDPTFQERYEMVLLPLETLVKVSNAIGATAKACDYVRYPPDRRPPGSPGGPAAGQ